MKKIPNNSYYSKTYVLLIVLCGAVSGNIFSDQQETESRPDTHLEVHISCTPMDEYPRELLFAGPGGHHKFVPDRTKAVQHLRNIIEPGRHYFGIKLPNRKDFFTDWPSSSMVTLFDTKTQKFSSKHISGGRNEIFVKENQKVVVHLFVERSSGNKLLPLPKVPGSIDIYMKEFRKIEETTDEIHYRVKVDIIWRPPAKEK